MLRVAIRPGTPNLAILGTSSGAYTSSDDGENWNRIASVGGTAVHDVAFDPKNPAYIYLAINGGVVRSSDGGQSFVTSYSSMFGSDADVLTITIDPFDPDTAYIGTMRGAFVTHNLRTAKASDWTPLAGFQSTLSVPRLEACTRHPGHLYALTRLELNTISYAADAPESAVWESWDGGHIWRPLFSGDSDGKAQTFALDTRDPDQLWIAWSTALHRLERTADSGASGGHGVADQEPPGPPMEEVILATLRHQGLELEEYTAKLQGAKTKNLLPRALQLTTSYVHESAGGTQDDAQFSADRYLQVAEYHEWQVMAWASWDLPGSSYTPDAVPMVRQRINTLNDDLRRRLVETVRRSYGELERIRAVLAAVPLDLRTRVIYRLRIEELAAVVDLSSGGYLARWHNNHRRDAK